MCRWHCAALYVESVFCSSRCPRRRATLLTEFATPLWNNEAALYSAASTDLRHAHQAWSMLLLEASMKYHSGFFVPVNGKLKSCDSEVEVQPRHNGPSPAEIVGSNPTGGMDICLLWVSCVVRQRSLRRADHSSRGVLPTVVRRCVSSRNIKNMCSIYIWH